MKTLSLGMMAATFVLGLGAISVLFLLGKAVLKLAVGFRSRRGVVYLVIDETNTLNLLH